MSAAKRPREDGSSTLQDGFEAIPAEEAINSSQHFAKLEKLNSGVEDHNDWRALGGRLGFKDDELDMLKRSNPQNPAKAVLKAWFARGKVATVKELHDALVSIRQEGVSEALGLDLLLKARRDARVFGLAERTLLQRLDRGDQAQKEKESSLTKSVDTATLKAILPKAIYGRDTRVDAYDFSEAQLRTAECVVSLWEEADVSPEGDGSVMRLRTSTLAQAELLRADQRFKDQPVGAFGTGFLVNGPDGAADCIVTAGHCVNAATLRSTVFVFGFRVPAASAPNDAPSVVPTASVYRGRRLLGHALNGATNEDWAVVQLDRAVQGHVPAKLRQAADPKPLALGDQLYVLGHPSGLPLKAATGTVSKASNGTYFVTNLSTFAGNSGSPVFNAATNCVEGILVRGKDDYKMRNGLRVVCEYPLANGGEECTDIRLASLAGLLSTKAATPAASPMMVMASVAATAHANATLPSAPTDDQRCSDALMNNLSALLVPIGSNFNDVLDNMPGSIKGAAPGVTLRATAKTDPIAAARDLLLNHVRIKGIWREFFTALDAADLKRTRLQYFPWSDSVMR